MRVYRKYRGALRTKRHAGTFSLSNQVVLRMSDLRVMEGVKIIGIHVDAAGYKRGHCRIAGQTVYVEQFGKFGWKTVEKSITDYHKDVLRRIHAL